jgi:hypothetical protein
MGVIMVFFKKVLETSLSRIDNLIIISRNMSVQCISYQEKNIFLKLMIWLSKTKFREHINFFCFKIRSQLQQKFKNTHKNPNL